MAFEYAQFVVRNPSYVTQNMRKQWEVRKSLLAFKKAYPVCEATGKNKGLEVHHVIPVSVAPNLAAVWSNMITLEKKAHLVLGHAGNYKSYVPNVRKIVNEIQIQRTAAATQGESQ